MPSKKNKKKARRNTARQQKNDTTDAQDEPPVNKPVDGNDLDKEEDEDMDDPSPTPPLVPENRPEVGDWVIDIIRKFTKDRGDDVMNKLFLTDEPSFKDVHDFFRELNDNIRAANMVHGAEDIRVGEIPAHTYEAMYQSWKMELAKPEVQNNPSEAWKAYDKVYQALDNFNREYNLPLGWNISASAAEQAFGQRPSSEVPVAPTPEGEDSDLESGVDESSESSSEVEEQSDDDYAPSAIDLLEARARKEERSLTGAKVLFWWSKGTGTQIFVRYGSKSKPIFRVRAGSHEYYDKKRVTRVLSSQNRGYMKKPEVIDGIPGETWKYGRRDVSNILGVGWKVEDDDDENGIDPLEFMVPEPGSVYPETRVLVEWKDGETTLEARAFVRRIANGSSLDGDRLIFQKAKELEEAYREDNKAVDWGNNEDDEALEGEEVEQGTPVRGKSPLVEVWLEQPAHYGVADDPAFSASVAPTLFCYVGSTLPLGITSWSPLAVTSCGPKLARSGLNPTLFPFHGRRVSYNMIYSYFAELAREQQTILTERIDSITLVQCIPRFLHLQSIELPFIDSTKKPFCWLSGRLFVGWRDSYPVHFETVIDAMVAARRNGIIVRKFKVSGFYSKISMPGTSLFRKVMEALHNVEDLRLVDSSRLLNFMRQVSLPSVRRLELAKCWLSVKDLEEFFRVHSGTLHSLHLEDTWLPTETVHEWGISLCSGSIETIVDRLATIRRLGTLRRLTINEKASGCCYQYKELFDGISTTWSIE
ncbi:unnamed protein product [Aspergillus oryzae]|nr:unnamed protein product [Aspergillus oryzae]GMF96337.1 unnamed protein product [Aspergillus oryzae]